MPLNYYREYVHDIPGDSYPGMERIVIVSNGEYYYSPSILVSLEEIIEEA